MKIKVQKMHKAIVFDIERTLLDGTEEKIKSVLQCKQ